MATVGRGEVQMSGCGLMTVISLSCRVMDYKDRSHTYPEGQVVVQLLADGSLGSEVLVVRGRLGLLHVLLLPLLHGGLVGLLVVGDGLDDVLSAARHRLEVALDLALVLHGGGGQTQLTGPPVHAGVLLLPAAMELLLDQVVIFLIPLIRACVASDDSITCNPRPCFCSCQYNLHRSIQIISWPALSSTTHPPATLFALIQPRRLSERRFPIWRDDMRSGLESCNKDGERGRERLDVYSYWRSLSRGEPGLRSTSGAYC